MERAHERKVELVLELVTGDARQPVVGVDGVDIRHRRRGSSTPVGELVDDLGERLLGEVRRAGLDVHHPEAGLDLDHVGGGRRPSAGVGGRRRPPGASDETSSRTYTFMPPPSPVPGWSERRGVQGEHATRRITEIKR